MALIKRLAPVEVYDLVHRVKEDPDNIAQHLKDYNIALEKSMQTTRLDVVSTILLFIYDYDYAALRNDLTSLLLVGIEDGSKATRRTVLMSMLPSIRFYFDGDYSHLLNFLTEFIKDDWEELDLPFM